MDQQVELLLNVIRSGADDQRLEAVEALRELIDNAWDEVGARLGNAVRQRNGLTLLAGLLADPWPDLQSVVLNCLGNLASDYVDPQSFLTKQLLVSSNRLVFSCLNSPDHDVLFMCCAMLQNLTNEPAWARTVVEHHVETRLQELLNHADERVGRYASGALMNVMQKQKEVGEEVPQLSEQALSAVENRELFTISAHSRRIPHQPESLLTPLTARLLTACVSSS